MLTQLFHILYHKLQVFLGNSNRNGIVKNLLQEFASAKFIRFKPTAYSGFKALRVEVYGILLTKGIYLLLFLSPPETKIKSHYSNYLWKTSLGNCAECKLKTKFCLDYYSCLIWNSVWGDCSIVHCRFWSPVGFHCNRIISLLLCLIFTLGIQIMYI